jgi:hypothetical protein
LPGLPAIHSYKKRSKINGDNEKKISRRKGEKEKLGQRRRLLSQSNSNALPRPPEEATAEAGNMYIL